MRSNIEIHKTHHWHETIYLKSNEGDDDPMKAKLYINQLYATNETLCLWMIGK